MTPYYPESYTGQLTLMIGSMLCWGSWASTLKLVRNWPFQLFYWDYVAGVLLGSLVWGLTLGGGGAFASNLLASDGSHILYALAAGMVFNLANQLLVAAIDIAGLAVAFPVGIGIALILGVLLNFILSPAGNPVLLFSGVFLVLVAIVFDAQAYRRRDAAARRLTTTGLVLSVVSGILMGLFYPILTRALQPPREFTSYAAIVYFSLGVILCAIPVNYLLMRRPLNGTAPLALAEYFKGTFSGHAVGVIGGIIWCTGIVFNLVASRGAFVGPAISYAIGQGATMVSAAWGVFVWREFRGSSNTVRMLLALMFFFFLIGLTLIALAPKMH